MTYILGAGFSCGTGLPLSYNFLEKMKEVHPQYQLGITPPSLNVPMDELFRFRTERFGLFDQKLLNNVEFWLSLVSARTLGSVASRDFIKYQMQISIAQTIEYYTNNSKYTDFVDHFIVETDKHNKKAIITLNYDDLLEQSCERLKKPFRHGFIRHASEPAFDLDHSLYTGNMLDVHEKLSSIPIFKLHGSYNWMIKGNSLHIISDMRKLFSHYDFWATEDWLSFRFLIEPPTVDKGYAGHILSGLWGAAYNSLASTCHIIVIGYSFPENDNYVKYLIMASLADNDTLKEVTIVDPGCDDSYKSRIKWLLDLLKAKKVSVNFCQQAADSWIHNKNMRSSLS